MDALLPTLYFGRPIVAFNGRFSPETAFDILQTHRVTHSFLFCAGVLGLWFAVLGDVEWAMLALPVHLLGDRGLFGNTYKPSSLPFEPAPLPPAARLAALSSAAAVGCPAPSCAASATAATPASGSPPAIARGR